MRTIKFRGFHADENGETVIKIDGKDIRGLWLAGDLKQYDGECWIEEHAVIPETVGQYVCDDENGKEVFEGDIVGNERIIGFVFYNCEFAFLLKWKNTDKYRKDFFKTCFLSNYSGLNEIEVIGNIFENPELLEVEK